MLAGVGSIFVVSLIACCTRLLAHLIACAIKSFKNYFLHNEVVQCFATRLLAHLIACAIKSFKSYFLHNEVVQSLVVSAYEVCSASQSRAISAQRSCAVTGNFRTRSVWFCTTECVVLHNGVCGSAQRSVWSCTTKLCSAANGGT